MGVQRRVHGDQHQHTNIPSFAKVPNPSIKMKSVAALALVALARASPMARDANDIAARDGHKMDDHKMEMAGPFTFTSSYNVIASPNQVVNSYDNVICYNITIDGFQGEYQSPADTATHIHEAMTGMSGPPRIAFPNPVDIGGGRRNSIGCLRGPFTTGVLSDGTDTGEGFHVSQIEENPAAFFSDTHSSLAVPGATRGQLGGPECK